MKFSCEIESNGLIHGFVFTWSIVLKAMSFSLMEYSFAILNKWNCQLTLLSFLLLSGYFYYKDDVSANSLLYISF